MHNNLSKAQALKYVESESSLFKVPEFIIFTTKDYIRDPNLVINKIKTKFEDCKIVIRSSASDEDGLKFAKAGEYESVLNVSSNDQVAVSAAIDEVINSYKREDAKKYQDEFIVQKMLLNTSMSGVVFTHDLNTGAPYYVVNYDDISGLTDTVTSGGGEYSNRTLYIHRGAPNSLRSERFQRLIQAIHELEHIMESQFLDVEFALGEEFTPYLLQVRAITTQPNWNRAVAKRINSALLGIQSFVNARLQPMEGVYGRTTVLGQMPDWNPAEMIGRAPRALAFSLYKTLITDNTWRIARETMGYAVPTGQALMVSLAGQPFIDTRLSFHSYLPAGLSPKISDKLVNVWVEQLKANPERHDKVEFEVAITTYSFDINQKINTLIGQALTEVEKNEFKESLRQQTLDLVLDCNAGGISKALGKIEKLAVLQKNASKISVCEDVSSLFLMVDNCIRLGTVPFSIMARHGFIARTILLSLNSCGILSEEDIHSIQSGIKTVTSTLMDDMHRLQLGKLSRADFMAEYGHLRPGTYDILSQRYDQMSEFGMNDLKIQPEHKINKFEISKNKMLKIDQRLKDEGLSELNADKLLNYIEAATIGREYSKFIFTRSVSAMLEIIAGFAEKHGLSREEVSHVPLDCLLDVVTKSNEDSIEERLRKISEDESEKHALNVAIRLPQVLFDEAGVHVIPFQVSHPNFITQKKITASCVHLKTGQDALSLAGKIVLIENADPGFDWIFSQNIGGLITKYGGANSHMAIRCAEFGIPAAIGSGEQIFDLLVKTKQIHLDCSAGLINSLH